MTDHVIKSDAIGRLSTASSFPQNLVHIRFLIKTLVDNIKKLVLQSETVITK